MVAFPLFIAAAEPVADEVTSTGLTLSSPEYSCAYTMPKKEIAVPKVAVIVFVPAAMFFA